MRTETVKGITFTRINNDINGNPRYVVHFLALLTQRECETLSPIVTRSRSKKADV